MRYFVLILLLGYQVNCAAQNWLWAHDGEGIGNNVSNAITVDDQGNTYITGYIAGAASFSGTNYQGRGVYDVLIAKYDGQGNVLWVKLAGGDGNDIAYAIKYQNGYLYLAGSFEDTAYFETTQLISKGAADAFVAKYDNNGNLVWAKSAGGPNQDYASSLDVDNNGNVFIAGQYQNSMTFGTTSISTSNLYNESFYARYDNNGNLQWVKSTTGNNTNLITGLAFDHSNAFFLTGFFSGSFMADTGSLISQSPSYDIFLAKMDENANLVWIKKAGSPFDDAARAVCSDNNGNAIITGYYSGTAYFDNDSITQDYSNDVFVAKYDGAGNNLWVRAGKGPLVDIGFAVTTDNIGNIFATGVFQHRISFDGNAVTCPARQLFTVSYDNYGNVRWLTAAGGTQTAAGLGIAVAPSGSVDISGYYEYSCIFGSTTLTIADASDIFIASYHPPTVIGISEVEEMDISVYPNPVKESGILNLYTNEKRVGYNAYNMLGQLILSGTVTNQNSLNMAGLPAGIYTLRFTSGEKWGARKVAIE